jgi:hypothetical protein
MNRVQGGLCLHQMLPAWPAETRKLHCSQQPAHAAEASLPALLFFPCCPQHSLMEPEDNAFVVARLPLPADSTDTAAVAAAWPPDTLGYSNLKPQPPQQPDLVLAELAALHAQDAQAQPGVSGGDSNSGSSLGGGLWPLRQRTRSTASAPGAGAVGGASAQPVHAWSDPQPVRYSTLQQLDRNSDSSPARARGEGSGRASHDASSLGRADSGYSAPEPIVRGDSGYADGPAGGLSADVSTAAAGGVPSIREAGPGGQQQQQQPERVRSILVKVPGVQGAVMHTSSGKGRNTGVSFARAAGEQQDDAS